jgi:hypothetical protein
MIVKKYHNPTNHKKFDYYIRSCRDCDEIFKAETKNQKYCENCLKQRIITRHKNSLETRKQNRLIKQQDE